MTKAECFELARTDKKMRLDIIEYYRQHKPLQELVRKAEKAKYKSKNDSYSVEELDLAMAQAKCITIVYPNIAYVEDKDKSTVH